MRARSVILICALLALLVVPGARGDRDPDSGAPLIGTPAPAWRFDRWVRGKPVRLEQLRGKVVLLRWWTEGCRFCTSTLPVLEGIRQRHEREGLVVIGVFHPKPPRRVTDRHVLDLAKEMGWNGPIALDERWSMLARYWLDGDPERSWTSVSFLVDRKGTIRWVHGGGEYHPSKDPRHARCELEYRELERRLGELLAEPAAALERQP